MTSEDPIAEQLDRQQPALTPDPAIAINEPLGSNHADGSRHNSSRSLVDLEEAARATLCLRAGHSLSHEEWTKMRLRLVEFAMLIRPWKPAKCHAKSKPNSTSGIERAA